jgi:hypothetical protein
MIVAIGGWAAFSWLGLTALGLGLLILRSTLGPPFSTHTLTHSMVESVDMLSSLALAPVVVAVFRLCGPSLISYAGAAVGLASVLLMALLDVLFALDVLTFGVGPSLPWLAVGGAALVLWMVLAGLCLLRTRALPAYLGWLTIATGLLIPLPIWAFWWVGLCCGRPVTQLSLGDDGAPGKREPPWTRTKSLRRAMLHVASGT